MSDETLKAHSAALDKALTPHGHNEPCYYCGDLCNALHGNPGLWPLPFCHREDPGVVKWHHTHCVTSRLEELERLRSVCRIAADHLEASYMALPRYEYPGPPETIIDRLRGALITTTPAKDR